MSNVTQMSDARPSWVSNVADKFVNLIAGIGVPGRDKLSSHRYVYAPLSMAEVEMAYRGDWIARKVVDVPALDMTRQWRAWKAEQDQIELLEKTEKDLRLQQKVQQALIRARLYGGAALIMGVEQGNPEEELIVDAVGQGDLKFIHVLSMKNIAIGPMIWDVTSPYWGMPQWYQMNTPGISQGGGGLGLRLHPSRVVRLLGLPPPDIVDPSGWGESVLQPIDDVIRSCGLVTGSIAALIAEMKVDVISVPDLTLILGGKDQEKQRRLIKRFSEGNVAKSVINSILLDKDETWTRYTANLGGMPEVLTAYLQIAAGAADIPAGRFLGLPHRGLNVTGEADFRNYYDRLASEQSVTLQPAMNKMDEVLIRSSLGERPPEIYYMWNSLWQIDDTEKATIALTKAQAYKIDADEGAIPPVALTKARINQLIEDGTYPGLDQTIEEAEAAGDTVEETAKPKPPPVMPPPAANGGAPPPPGLPPRAASEAENPASAPSGRDSVARDYNPDQPRVPGGSPEGGQWGELGGSGGEVTNKNTKAKVGSKPATSEKGKASAESGSKLSASDLEDYGITKPADVASMQRLDAATGGKAKQYLDSLTAEQNEFGAKHGLDAVDMAHLSAYTGPDYQGLNKSLRDGTATEAQQSFDHGVRAALDKLPAYNGVANRGVDLPASVRDGYKVGEIRHESAFLSAEGRGGAGWDGNTKFHITSSGTQTGGKDVSALSSTGKQEKEVLFKSGQNYKVTNVEDKVDSYGDVIRHVHMQEL